MFYAQSMLRAMPRTPVMQTDIMLSAPRDRRIHARMSDAHNAIARDGRSFGVLSRRSRPPLDRPYATERPQCPCNAAESRGICTYLVRDSRSSVLVKIGELFLEHIEEVLAVWHFVQCAATWKLSVAVWSSRCGQRYLWLPIHHYFS